jgi:Cysteine-rich CPXCG
MSEGAGFVCAGCGEWNETFVDASAGRRQSYVEDCQVCCKPNLLRIAWGNAGEGRREGYRIDSELES